MMAVGIQVLGDSILSMFQGGKESPDILAAYVGLGSALVMYFVYRYNRRLAEKINSKAVMAASKDNLSDAWVSIGTAVGIFGSPILMVMVCWLLCHFKSDKNSNRSNNICSII